MMIIPMPGWQPARIRCPHSLQGHWRGSFPGCGPVIILDKIVMLLDLRIRDGYGGPGPESVPPPLMLLKQFLITCFQSPFCLAAGKFQRFLGIVVCGG